MMEITSTHNPRVKAWVQLLERKGRDKQQRFLVEGVHLVQEALLHTDRVETVAYDRERGLPAEVEAHVPAAVERIAVTGQVLQKCTDTVQPQPVFAVVRKERPDRFRQWAAKQGALIVVVDGVQDPGNLGTIIRAADAAGADGVVLGKGTVDLYNPKTIRSTMGSLFHVPVVEADLADWFGLANEAGAQVIGTSLQTDASCYDVDYTRSSWIVVGNEGQGVSPQWQRYMTHNVKIPMLGKAESLNVAMAATVMLFEAVRQRILWDRRTLA